MEYDHEVENVELGEAYCCSNWECRAKDVSGVVWEPLTYEELLSKDIGREHVPNVYEKYPSLDPSPREFYSDGDGCHNCGCKTVELLSSHYPREKTSMDIEISASYFCPTCLLVRY